MLLKPYSWLLTLAQPVLRAKLRRRGSDEPGYLQVVEERFGHYAMPAGAGFVWLHAVSLGETRAAAILIERLREAVPGMRLLLTHGTATGRAEGARLLQPGDVQAWLPWDTQPVVDRFLAHFRPRIGILMETEVWPQLASRCKLLGVPLVLANARLSAKSLHQAQRLGWLSRPAYRSLAAVWAQSADDAARLERLGARVAGVFGNLKFDAQPDAQQLASGRAWRATVGKPVVMFASSREGEEAQLLEQVAAHPGSGAVQWLVVPRHPQRFDEVAALVAQHGMAVSRRSSWGDSPHLAGAQPDVVWLGDSLGEMALYYGMAHVALLGGSFEPLGGQNLIEAAACGCPVVMGPSTFNFADAAALAIEAGAAQQVASMQQAVAAAISLATSPVRQDAMGRSGLRFAAEHRGAAGKTASAIAKLLSGPELR